MPLHVIILQLLCALCVGALLIPLNADTPCQATRCPLHSMLSYPIAAPFADALVASLRSGTPCQVLHG